MIHINKAQSSDQCSRLLHHDLDADISDETSVLGLRYFGGLLLCRRTNRYKYSQI